MHPLEIRKAQRQVPFEPFRLHLTNGSTFDVPHPDFLMITKLAIHVAVDPVGSDDIPSQDVRISPMHITHIEPMTQESGINFSQ
jgi:hypothetical protein